MSAELPMKTAGNALGEQAIAGVLQTVLLVGLAGFLLLQVSKKGKKS